MSRLIRAARARHRDDAEGFTLIEMLVAMFVFTIFCTMVLSIYITLVGAQLNVSNKFNSTGEAQTVMDRITTELRAAVYCSCGSSPDSPIASGDADDITFYAALGGSSGPTEIQFKLTGNQLVEVDIPAGGEAPHWTFSPSSATTSILSPSIGNNATTAPLFTYYNQSGTALSVPMTTTAQTSAVENVNVNLVLQASSGKAPAATVDADIHLVNVDFGDGSD